MKISLTNKGRIKESELPAKILYSDQSIYEVIRLIDGVALFLEDHYHRLKNSMKIQGNSFDMEFWKFKQIIAELVSLNHQTEGNIKFVYTGLQDANQWIFSFIPHDYPYPEDYLKGISTGLLYAERQNPNAKVILQSVRERADQLLADRLVYEVLLVDHEGCITEGSRSNVFFVEGEVFYTAPASKVLEGITRQKVLECLDELSFPVKMEAVRADQIGSFDAVFLTGTSPKILPVRSIENQVFSVQLSCVQKLMERYNQKIENYIQNEKNSGKK